MNSTTMMSKVSPSITKMIRMDHTHVMMAFHRYRADTSPQRKRALAEHISMALEVHAQLEEEIFYPAMREIATGASVVSKSVPEHDEMRRLIARLRELEPGEESFDAVFMELMRDVMHHVADEETVLLPAAERLLADRLGSLGAAMTRRRLELVGPRAGELASTAVRAMPAASLLVGAGALLAGGYVLKRALGGGHHARAAHH